MKNIDHFFRVEDVLSVGLRGKVILVLLVVFAAMMTTAHAHQCGPQLVAVTKGGTTTYTISGGLPADYTIVPEGNASIATISPASISGENSGVFTVTGTGVGVTSFSIFWKGVEGGGDEAQGTCTFTVNVSPPSADLMLEMSATPEKVEVGGTVTLVLTARNLGPGRATGVVLSTGFSTDLVIQSNQTTQGSCSGKRCELGDLDMGATAVVTIVATVTNTPMDRTVQIASVTSTAALDPNLNNNLATARVESFQSPRLDAQLNEAGRLRLQWSGNGRLQMTTNLFNAGTEWADVGSGTDLVSPLDLGITNSTSYYRLKVQTNALTPLPFVRFNQLDLEVDGVRMTNSHWGSADLTFQGTNETVYFNIWTGAQWVVSNVPIVSVLGSNVAQTVTLNFPLSGEGAAVTNQAFAWGLTSTNTGSYPPVDFRFELVHPRRARIFSGLGDTNLTYFFPSNLVGGSANSVFKAHPTFPNREQPIKECVSVAIANSLEYLNTGFALGIDPASITSEIMKLAVGFNFQLTNGPPSANNLFVNSWVDNKIQYMSANDLPIETGETTDIAVAMAALAMGHDVEIEMEGHVASVVAIVDAGNGVYSLTLSHDILQGEAGGTVHEIVIFRPNGGLFQDSLSGSFWSKDFITFVIERPDPH